MCDSELSEFHLKRLAHLKTTALLTTPFAGDLFAINYCEGEVFGPFQRRSAVSARISKGRKWKLARPPTFPTPVLRKAARKRKVQMQASSAISFATESLPASPSAAGSTLRIGGRTRVILRIPPPIKVAPLSEERLLQYEECALRIHSRFGLPASVVVCSSLSAALARKLPSVSGVAFSILSISGYGGGDSFVQSTNLYLQLEARTITLDNTPFTFHCEGRVALKLLHCPSAKAVACAYDGTDNAVAKQQLVHDICNEWLYLANIQIAPIAFSILRFQKVRRIQRTATGLSPSKKLKSMSSLKNKE